MKRMSSRDRALLITAGAAIAAFAFTFGIALPSADQMADLSRDIGELKSKLARATKMYAQAPAIESEIAASQEALSALAHPEGEIIPAIVREIESRAADLGLTVSSIRPAEPVPTDGCLRYPIRIEVEANCDRVVKLLYELEKEGSRLWVEGVEVNAERGATSALRTTVNIAVYALLPLSEESDDEANG